MSGLVDGVNENIQVKNDQEKYDVKLGIREWKRYPEYKDSGVEWIGEIPEHWEIKRLKRIIADKLKYGANESAELEDQELPRYIRITDFGENGRLKEDTFKSLPIELANDYLLNQGDILFARSGATVGKTFQFKNYSGKACFAGYLIKASPDEKKIISDFLYLYTKSSFYEQWKNSTFIQATIQNIGADKYQSLELTVPPLPEQQAISTFLDRETSKIDTLIEKKQRLIELLEEKRSALISHAVTKGLDPYAKKKNSGVEWIGEIPEGWFLSKLKYLTSKIGSGKTPRGGSEIYCDSGILFLRSQNVHFDGLRLDDVVYIDESIDSEMSSTRVLPDDVLLNITGASIGRSSIVPKDFPQANVNQHVCITRPLKKKIDSRLLHYELSSNGVQALIFSNENGTSREGLTFSQISNFVIAIPNNLDEQRHIANFLDRETEKIDTFINKISAQIEKLKEYRTALISAAVTGKIDVREEVA